MIQFLVLVCDGTCDGILHVSKLITRLCITQASRWSASEPFPEQVFKWSIILYFSECVSFPFFHFLPSLAFTFQIYQKLQSWMGLNFHYVNIWTDTLKDTMNLPSCKGKWHFSIATAASRISSWPNSSKANNFHFVINLLP